MTEAAAKLCKDLIASKGNPPIIGGVALHRVIGSGGMGVVYHGTHLRLRIPVAVKFLVLDRADSYSVARFVDEASLAAKVSSPNVVRVYDVNKEGGFEYIVQEFVNGQTSDQRLRDTLFYQQKLGEDFVLELAADTARGLAAIHDADYLHLDIKPANIMISRRDGVCKILDFGLAQPFKRTVRPGSVPENNAIPVDGGTPGYSSPEQLQMLCCGQSSDIYSLGVSLFELLTGSRAFLNVETWEKAQEAQSKEPPPNVQTLRPDISSATAALVERCTRVNPNQRFDSAMELLSEIAKVKQQRMSQATAASTINKTESGIIPSSKRKNHVPFVVCVDDNAQICMLMAELLEEAGFRAETFTEGARAINRMRQHPPDVIFLDMDMPGMTGLEVCAEIRSSPILKSIPVVFITGETSPETMRKAMHEGATDYLFKPVQADELISRVQCLTRISRAQLELTKLENQFSQFRTRLSTMTGKESV